ncbi:MAG: VWA domain-containing protein [Bizionia sp.]|nr:VWA domain-containing protein [Bizionia sp.]
MNIKRVLIATMIFVSTLSFGQNFKSEKRIYLLDITKSMWGSDGGDDVYEEVKNALYKGIHEIKDPETIVTIIPFQATHTYEVLDSWTFKSGDTEKLTDIKKIIDSYSLDSVPGGYTDIYSALEIAKKHIADDKINYIFLLTDGEQSPVPSSYNKVNRIDFDEANLIESLSGWCNYSANTDTHLFYVMLTKAADIKEIANVIEKECNAYVVKGTNVNITFIQPYSKHVKINLNDEPSKLDIKLSANNWSYLDKDDFILDLELENNDLFELSDKSVKIENQKIVINLKRKNNTSFKDLKKNSPEESTVRLILSTLKDVKILNPEISIIIRNKQERKLTLEFTDEE